MGYNATTLSQVFATAVTPNGAGGGIWQSGTGPSADATGNIYVAVGNGSVDAPNAGQDYGNGILKLSRTGEVLDWFIPSDYETLNRWDGDLGTTGVLVIPGTDLLATGSKGGKLYVLDRNNMGHFQPGADTQIVQSLSTGPGWLQGTPTYWLGPAGPYVYVWCSGSQGRAFRLAGRALSETSKTESSAAAKIPVAIGKTSIEFKAHTLNLDAVLTEYSSTKALSYHIPGGILSISADGTTAGSGILWAVIGLGSTYMGSTVPGALRAFDAADLSHELWNSEEKPARDRFGKLAKFNTPVIANGKVYLATFSRQVVVYGLLPDSAP
jgi:hypothetical protein